ncbi:MAG: O-sialoglycoprotein endopeptidase [Firmicutes bacterium HGW-Firmicutes-8]|nr:MAG: O-sialoglycoprotein endopeptidase [Firmicutes bacterium HGW-Firmicutes-8]
MELYLGIDTSCYTTSLAVIDGEGNLFSEARKMLAVPSGNKGLAQNEAVFQHLANLPGLYERICRTDGFTSLRGIAASVRPRPVDGSYMPVFKVAESFGRATASLLNLTFVETSHQEGHLAAGVWSAHGPREREFLAVHLSGGTTELLRVVLDNNGLENSGAGNVFNIRLLGGSSDLHAGQFIDRIGVALGLPFPAGPHLEELARKAQTDLTVPSSVKKYDISYSGPETAALRLIQSQAPAAEIARAVEKCIANSLEKVIRLAVADTGLQSVLIVGGVSANKYIRDRLSLRLSRIMTGGGLYFAGKEWAGDNAVGVALLGAQKIRKQTEPYIL